MLAAGLDVGSARTKVVLWKDGGVLGRAVVVQGSESVPATVARVLDEGADTSGVAVADFERIAVTGVGREECDSGWAKLVDGMCLAQAADRTLSSTRVVLDVGAQKVLAVRCTGGKALKFSRNEQCAGGEFRAQESMMEDLGFPPAHKLLGRTATPMEVSAAEQASAVWSGRVERRILTTIEMCKRYSLDGIVHFQQSGCPMGQSTAQIMDERVQAELNIPSLLLDGRMLDQEWYDETQIFSQLEEFIEQCVAYKEMRGVRVGT